MLVVTIGNILDDLKIPYAVTGGLAVSILGRIRTTLDIDVIVELPQAKVPALTKALKQISDLTYVDEETALRAVERTGEFNFLHIESGIKVDFFVLGSDAFSKEKIGRRRPHTINGQSVYLVSPEDLILSKLPWNKQTESSRQLEDVESILAIQKNLNRPYLEKWSKLHKTDKVLRELWRKTRSQ